MPRWLARLVLAIFLAPAVFVLYQAAGPAGESTLAHFAGTLLPIYVGNTALLAGLAAALAVLVGAGGAFAVTFFDFPGRGVLATALVLPLVLPPYLVAILYREMSHLHAWSPPVESLAGAAAILGLTLYPYVFLLARASFRRQAAGYIEAGQALGQGPGRIAARVLLPLAAPAVLLGALLVAVEVISDFGTASVLGLRTLTIAVHRAWFTLYDETLAAQLALLGALLPLLLLAGFAALARGRGFTLPTNRPRPPHPTPLDGTRRWLVPAALALPVLVGFAWPVTLLLGWAAEAFGRLRLDDLYQDLLHTLALAAGTTALALLLGLALALVGRASSRGWISQGWTGAAVAILSLNYAMPAILLAVALLFLTGWTYGTTAGAWLADTVLLVLLATTLRFTAFAYFGAESGLAGVSRRLDEAVRCLGRPRLGGVLGVLLPQIRGPLAVGGLLVFVITAKELTLSLVLQPFGYGSLALSIYHFAAIDLYPPAAVYALVLVLVVLYPVLSIDRWLTGR